MTTYYQNLTTIIRRYQKNPVFMKGFETYQSEIIQIISLDLEPIMPLLDSLYCPIHYSEHRPPDCMLRSLLLMTALKIHSIDDWVKETRRCPALAAVARFDPSDTPGVGTYYDFMNRLINGPYQKTSDGKFIQSNFCSALYERVPQQEKKDSIDGKKRILSEWNSLSEKLVSELLSKKDEPRPDGYEKRLQDIFILLGLKPTL